MLRVDMTAEQVRAESLPTEYRYLGGRALSSRIVLDEVSPTCDPLGPDNKLVFAGGLFAGTLASSSNRVSIGAKSPLTGGIKESNGGGETTFRMAQLGLRAIIIEGAPRNGGMYVLVLNQGGARLERAEELRGLTTQATADKLREKYGKKAMIAAIGLPGELRLRGAGVVNSDRDGVMSRISARGGLGAVMGAKGLKAMVIQVEGLQPIFARDKAAWQPHFRAYNELIRTSPTSAETFPKYGTATTLEFVNKHGGLPTRNFSRGRFEQADDIGGYRMFDVITARGGVGKTTHACMTGCAIRCSNIFADTEGRFIVSPIEFETLGLLGSNLEVKDLDGIARLNYLCNEYGLDTIETGGALGVAMEAGLLPFGDVEAALAALRSVNEGNELGRLLCDGALAVGKAYGVKRIPVVRNQTISAYDPRAIKGNGVTYCTSPMGADHTTGNTIFSPTDHLDPSDKVALSRRQQVIVASMDALGLCIFGRQPYTRGPEHFVGMINALYGWEHSAEWLAELGWETIASEVEFNRRAGWESPYSRLPEFFYTEPLAPHNALFDVPEAQMLNFWDPSLAPRSVKL